MNSNCSLNCIQSIFALHVCRILTLHRELRHNSDKSEHLFLIYLSLLQVVRQLLRVREVNLRTSPWEHSLTFMPSSQKNFPESIPKNIPMSTLRKCASPETINIPIAIFFNSIPLAVSLHTYILDFTLHLIWFDTSSASSSIPTTTFCILYFVFFYTTKYYQPL